MRIEEKIIRQSSKIEYSVTDTPDCAKIELSSQEQSIIERKDSMLSLTFVGRIVEKKEIITTSTGKKVCNFTVVNDKYNGKEKEKSSDFFQVAAWGGTAEFMVVSQKC